jgi:hypothetical protein
MSILSIKEFYEFAKKDKLFKSNAYLKPYNFSIKNNNIYIQTFVYPFFHKTILDLSTLEIKHRLLEKVIHEVQANFLDYDYKKIYKHSTCFIFKASVSNIIYYKKIWLYLDNPTETYQSGSYLRLPNGMYYAQYANLNTVLYLDNRSSIKLQYNLVDDFLHQSVKKIINKTNAIALLQ